MAKETLKQKPLIYSIDDDVSMNKLMEARFVKNGCDIKTFTTPKDLISEVRKKRPNLLLVDLNLGENFSGFDVIEEIRFELKYDFPIIVVSSSDQSQTVAHALEIGANDYVIKPILRIQFEEKVSEYIDAPNIYENIPQALKKISPEFQTAKLDFKMTLIEVSPIGFTLNSQHLIKKGSSFWLSGKEIKKIIPSEDKVFVTVLGSAMQMSDEHRLYHIKVEIDPTQENVVNDIKSFLNSKRMEES